ncbi:MAG: hypothetical protein WA510_27140 [Acidobacteriaceae bacterium]
MLESVTRVREIHLRGGRIYLQPLALDAGHIYDLAPDYAQKLMSSGKAVFVEGPPLPASTPGQTDGVSRRTGIFRNHARLSLAY